MIRINCVNCRKKLEAPEEAAGKKGRCPGCGQVFDLPSKISAAGELTSRSAECFSGSRRGRLESDLESFASRVWKTLLIKHLFLIAGVPLAGGGAVSFYEKAVNSRPVHLLGFPADSLLFSSAILLLLAYKFFFSGALNRRLGEIQSLYGMGRDELFDFSLGVEKLSKRYDFLSFLDSEKALAKEIKDKSEDEQSEKLGEAEYFFGMVHDDEDYLLVSFAAQCQSAGRAEHEPGSALPLCLARVWFAACCMAGAREHVLISEHGILGGHYNDIESWQVCAFEALSHLENAKLNPLVPRELINTLVDEAERVFKVTRQEAEKEGTLKTVRTEYEDIGMFPRIMLPYWFQGMRETDFTKSDVIRYVKKLPRSDILLNSYGDLMAMDGAV